MRAREFKLGSKKQVLLAIDQAGWHISKDLRVPEGLHLILLPSHSPEIQPAERLWPLVDEPIANRSFETLSDARGSFISSLPIFIATARFDSRFNRLSLVDSNWGLVVSDDTDMS